MLYKQCRFPPFNETLNGPRNHNTEHGNEAQKILNAREGLWVADCNQAIFCYFSKKILLQQDFLYDAKLLPQIYEFITLIPSVE